MKTPKRTQKRKCRDPQSNALFQVYFNTNIELLSKTIEAPDGTATSLESVLMKPPFTNIVYAAPATMTFWHAARCAATHIQDWAQRYNLCLIPDPPSSDEETSGESEGSETEDSTDSAESSDSDSSSNKKRSSRSLVLRFWLQRLTHNDISIVPNPRKGTLCEVQSIWKHKPEGTHYQWRVHSQKRVRCYSDEPPVPPSNPDPNTRPDEATGTGADQAAVKVTDTRSDDAYGSVEATGTGTDAGSVEVAGTGTHTAAGTGSDDAGSVEATGTGTNPATGTGSDDGTGTHSATGTGSDDTTGTTTAAATGSDAATGTGSDEGTRIASSAASVAMPVTSSIPVPVAASDPVPVAPTDPVPVAPTDQVASFGSDVTSTATTNILRLLKSARV